MGVARKRNKEARTSTWKGVLEYDFQFGDEKTTMGYDVFLRDIAVYCSSIFLLITNSTST